MTNRLSDEEYARIAARHALHPHGKPSRPDRLEPFLSQGVCDEKTLADHTLKVMQAPDTKCFRGSGGKECYANNRMNTIVITHENGASSTVYFNDMLRDNGEKATDRLVRISEGVRASNKDKGAICKIRVGGSKALEFDREVDRNAKESVVQKQVEPDPLDQDPREPWTAAELAEFKAIQSGRPISRNAAMEQAAEGTTAVPAAGWDQVREPWSTEELTAFFNQQANQEGAIERSSDRDGGDRTL